MNSFSFTKPQPGETGGTSFSTPAQFLPSSRLAWRMPILIINELCRAAAPGQGAAPGIKPELNFG